MRLPDGNGHAGLRPVDATSSAPGVRASRVRIGPSARPRWPGGSPLETSVTCDLLSEPGPVKCCDSSRPRRPDGRVMNLTRTLRLAWPGVKRGRESRGDIFECRRIRSTQLVDAWMQSTGLVGPARRFGLARRPPQRIIPRDRGDVRRARADRHALEAAMSTFPALGRGPVPRRCSRCSSVRRRGRRVRRRRRRPRRPSASLTMPTCKAPCGSSRRGSTASCSTGTCPASPSASSPISSSCGRRASASPTWREDADDAADQVPHGVAQQALHGDGGDAAARAGQAAARRPGVEVPAVVPREAPPIPRIRRSRSRSC